MIVTLIGSTRFAALFTKNMEALTLRGHTVFGLGYHSSHKEDGPGKGPTEDEKVVLDLVHMKKIMDSDAVLLVTDETMYFGESTRRELAWAALLNKPCYIDADGLSTEVVLMTPANLKEEVESRKTQAEKFRGALLATATPLGELLRSAAAGGRLPGEDDDEEDHGGKPN